MRSFTRLSLFLSIFLFSYLCLSVLQSVQTVHAATYGSGTYGCDTYSDGDCAGLPAATPTSAPSSNPVSNAVSSIASAISSWTCTSQAPRSAPDLFEIDAKDTHAIIYFSPADRPYTTYFVSFGDGLANEGYGAGFEPSQTTGALKYDVYHLKPKMNYTFKVRAGNGCKPGPWSSTMTIKTGAKNTRLLAKYYPKKQAVNTYGPPTVGQLIAKKVTTTAQKYIAPVVNQIIPDSNNAPTPQPAVVHSAVKSEPQQLQKIDHSTPDPSTAKSCFLFLCW